MGKKTLVGIGVGMLLLGLVGVYNAVNDLGKAPEEESDMTATGTVTDVFCDQLEHRLTGATVSSHFQFTFSFTAHDGQPYHGTETINEAQFNLLQPGQQVPVLYHSDQPSINAAKGYGPYVSVHDMPHHTPKTRLFGCLAFAVLGAGVIVLAYFSKDEDGNSSAERKERELVAH